MPSSRNGLGLESPWILCYLYELRNHAIVFRSCDNYLKFAFVRVYVLDVVWIWRVKVCEEG